MSEIADAIHADAEAARAEIRAAGLACPSCGLNMADLPWDHSLPLPENLGDPGCTVKCSNGAGVVLPDCKTDAGFKVCEAVANISLWDQMRKAEDEAFSRMLGWDIRGGPSPMPPFPGRKPAGGEQ